MKANEYLKAIRLNGVFSNPLHWNTQLPSTADLFRWKFGGSDNSNVPSDLELDKTLPVMSPDFSPPPSGKCKLTWLGHASVLLQVNSLNILTDPIFSERASPLSFAGPKRFRRCPISNVDSLPDINAILISHNHYDHFDIATITQLADKFPNALWYMPSENASYLPENVNRSKVFELNWWDEMDLGTEMKITCVPSQHWSKRGLFDTNFALWGGFVVSEKGRGSFFFAGDTGYSPVFKAIGERFKGFSISAIPIGAYEPEWFMKGQHVNRKEAVQIHDDVKSEFSVGIHWGTFVLTDEPYLEPKILEKRDKPFETLDHGASIVVPWI